MGSEMCIRDSLDSSPTNCEMDNSPIANLPPELRLLIYSYVSNEKRTVMNGSTAYQGNVLHPITRTCRQLRRVSPPLELDRTAMRCSTLKMRTLSSWLTLLSPISCSQLCQVAWILSRKEMERAIYWRVVHLKIGDRLTLLLKSTKYILGLTGSD